MFPWMAAGDAGRVAIAFATTPATSSDDLNAVWEIHMAQSLNALSASPAFNEIAVSDHPIHLGQVCASGILCTVGGDRSLLDFIELQLDPAGYANVVWTENSAGVRHVGFSRQTAGPSLFAPTKVLGEKKRSSTARPRVQERHLASTGAEDPWLPAATMIAMAVGLATRMRRRRVRA
jgi:hypothetical protein